MLRAVNLVNVTAPGALIAALINDFAGVPMPVAVKAGLTAGAFIYAAVWGHAVHASDQARIQATAHIAATKIASGSGSAGVRPALPSAPVTGSSPPGS